MDGRLERHLDQSLHALAPGGVISDPVAPLVALLVIMGSP